MNIYRFRGNGRLVTGIYRLISTQIVEYTSEMSSSHQNKNFDVLQAILHIEQKIFTFYPMSCVALFRRPFWSTEL